MSKLTNLTLILLLTIQWTHSYYLETSANYLKPQMERNNIVNKKIWVRNKNADGSDVDRARMGTFIFRPESMDAGYLQNVFDRFGDTALQDTPMVTGYVQRERRSLNANNNKLAQLLMSNNIAEAIIKSKIVSELKPATVVNEYPYAVALLLGDVEKGTKKEKKHVKHKRIEGNHTKEAKDFELLNGLSLNNSTNQRQKKNDLEKPNFNVIEETKQKNNVNTLTRSVYEKETMWNENNAPISDNNMYKLVTDQPDIKPKGVTEKGLIKVIAMLTRSFKRIMKHYKEILGIHGHILKATQDFDAKTADVFAKFEDFDSKYADMIQFSNKINEIGTKMNLAQEYLEQKYKKVEATFSEFQKQQKTFLGQQKQFFKLQKLMAAQNEKINAKQNQIAKTQSEISHRQNNFARILKKAKQVFLDKKGNTTNNNYSKGDNHDYKSNQHDKNNHHNYKNEHYNYKFNTNKVEPIQASTQSMKINLFSIPPKNKLRDQDDLIIKEKDEKQIDELIYKYYFNNTFIDNLMKSKILNNYAGQGQNIEIVRRAKNKRDESETTLMVPTKKNDTLKTDDTLVRNKRWINSFGKNYRKFQHKNNLRKENLYVDEANKVEKKVDPYKAMATAFCKEIGKKESDQSLKWCVEKSLRKLKMMDTKAHPLPVTVMSEKPLRLPHTYTEKRTTDGITTLRAVPSKSATVMTQDTTVTQPMPYTTLYPITLQTVYFPDNDELESNLKQYEIKPDTEGNVYYDGSLHISDFGHLASTPDSEGTSDVMPGLVDSNSQVEIDPRSFDLQAARRAYVNRMNEEIMKKLRL